MRLNLMKQVTARLESVLQSDIKILKDKMGTFALTSPIIEDRHRRQMANLREINKKNSKNLGAKLQNTRNINGGTAASGTLGQFYVARCGLIQ